MQSRFNISNEEMLILNISPKYSLTACFVFVMISTHAIKKSANRLKLFMVILPNFI